MELIYLWVEKYKNIHEQDFNFSGRYRCEYDKEKNELTINENKEYVHIFPDNINVTAIVGKNGSGKSSLLEFVIDIIINFKNDDMPKYLLVFNDGYFTNIEKLSSNKTKMDNIPSDLFTIVLDYSVDFFEGEHYRKDLYYIFDKAKNYIIEPNKFSQNKTNINIDLDNEKIRKRIISYNKKMQQAPSFADIFFIPKKVTIRIDPRRIPQKNTSGKKDVLKGDYLKDSLNWQSITKLNEIYETSFNDRYISQEEYDKTKNVIKLLSWLQNNNVEFKSEYFHMKHQSNIKEQEGLALDFNEITDEVLELLSILPRYFLLDFETDKDVKYSSLITGEKTIQKMLYTIVDYIEQSDKDNFFVLIDEVELYLHPVWQKKYIKFIVDMANLYASKKFHFVITSHSPFVISDMQKNNIIFLHSGKQDEGIVHKTTFGANIHTLLSDAFFMEDGLMGEYAKTKINKAIELLNKKGKLSKSSLKYCEDIISIIGEPILKKQLQRMLDSKRLSKIDRIDEIEKNILSLRQELERLKSK